MTALLVVGATGKTGRQVVARLRARGLAVRAASRTGEQRFDWADERTWAAALDGVAGAYVAAPDDAAAVPAFLARAADRGVERLVLLSARGIDVPGYFGDAEAEGHLRNEAALRATGARWTILRPGWFAQNFSEGLFLDPVRRGELRLAAGEGAAAFVDTGDIADVAVAALTGDGHAGEVYDLSGPRALTIAEALAEIERASGHAARYVAVPSEQYVDDLAGQGWSHADAHLWAAALTPIATGREAAVADGVRRALGREATDFADYARAAAAAWRPEARA
ncbi:NAD(P)H-binding protein [Dactylosporangium sp. AC04546]|uniref:NAD(P)H-binding protein n=1 Tax=Dactylosporangium sp. AC04546 TaxID=2862460 RepID=UPI001EDE79C7|nr:NAD(P)H-binding protein [Dactylosporangium sp. AC04546]WVK78497.1 NAD(P)H-binding protein [Dactylosporangium sp. AC04546]